MSKKIYLVRHGETEDLVSKLHQRDDVSLSGHGKQQSHDVAKRFGTIPVDAIYFSPFTRTMETAVHIAEITGAPFKPQDLLGEIKKPSELVGKIRDSKEVLDIRAIMHEHRKEPNWHYSDEENLFELKERVIKLQQFIATLPERNIVLVTHAAFIKMFAITAIFTDLANPDLYSHFYNNASTRQTGITIFSYSPNANWKLLTWNDYAHLGEDENNE